MKKNTLMTIAVMGLAGAASAGVIFEATTANTSLFNNDVNIGSGAMTLTGATPNLLLANSHGNFNAGGFASTDTINTLNGTALTSADTVTMSVTVDSITHTDSSQLRSRGFEWGMSGSIALDGGGADSFILRVGGVPNVSGQAVPLFLQQSFGAAAITNDLTFQATEASVADGFGVTLVANDTGFTFSFTGLEATPAGTGDGSGVVEDISGTWGAGEFATYFGAGHYYTSMQKRLAGTTTADFSEASISVIPEPATLGLVAVFGGGVLFIRRRCMI